MTLMYVQFSDSTLTKVTSVFSCSQDPLVFLNQAEIEDTDQRYLDFVNPPVDIVAVNTAQQASLANFASLAMTPLFMALQLGDATDTETVRAKAWQAYYRALQLVDITVPSPEWPVAPE